jgi:hypothetical protein
MKTFFWTGILLAFSTLCLQSQTVLTGNHLVTGNLEVGSHANLKTVLINGSLVLGGIFASGTSSIASGNSEVAGNFSMGLGACTVLGDFAVATGMSYVEGDFAAAFGSGYASGDVSFASGQGIATAAYAAALGAGTAEGVYGTALGLSTATAYCSVALGRNNIVGGNPGEWVATDELVVVGNGAHADAPSNALVLRKNAELRTGGMVQVRGIIRAAPGGGLDMGVYTAGQNPATLDAGLQYGGE